MYKILFLIAAFLYLAGQSIGDIKTKTVRKDINNFFLFLSTGSYLVSCFVCGYVPSISVILFTALLFFLSYGLHFFGTGDAKAFVTVYMTTRFLGPNILIPDIDLFLVFLLAAEVACFIGSFIARIVTHKKEERVPFFPYMTVGYVFMCIFATLI